MIIIKSIILNLLSQTLHNVEATIEHNFWGLSGAVIIAIMCGFIGAFVLKCAIVGIRINPSISHLSLKLVIIHFVSLLLSATDANLWESYVYVKKETIHFEGTRQYYLSTLVMCCQPKHFL